MSFFASRATRSKSARLVPSLASQTFYAPCRTFSLRFSRPRFASAAATVNSPSSPPLQPLGPYPYLPKGIQPDLLPNYTKVKAEQEQKKTKQDEICHENTTALPQTSFDERRVAVGWDACSWSRFHNVWLRDHCRCDECFHPVTKQRMIDTFEIPADLQPSKVTPTEVGLEVTWHGTIPHKSLYPWAWLHQNSYDPPLRPTAAGPPSPTVAQHEKVLWSSRIQQDPPTMQFGEIMEDERAVWKWLQKIERFGFCFVAGVPTNPQDTERLTRRIGNIRETQYGGFWDFTADFKHGDLAYSNMALKAHTDTTYFTDPCGLQLFHLLSHTQGTGGATLLVDGFYVASLLSTLEPEVYALLSQVPVPAHSAGASSNSPSSMKYLYHPKPKVGYPILNHDKSTGELAQVRYNNDDRSVMRHLVPSMVEPWYHALRSWNKALTSPDSEYWVQLAPGTAVIIDNQRVLHGRSAFTGERRVCGAYIGVDDYISRLNVLQAKFGPPPTQADTGLGSVWDPAL
ncbi:Trimethyllysine dioxygenase [Ramaria rubella]|nr:Trimethyllysine dioxygenase [Ramaria rubella]